MFVYTNNLVKRVAPPLIPAKKKEDKMQNKTKNSYLNIRLTKDEKEEITNKFKQVDLSLSEYMRSILLSYKPKIKKAKKADSNLLYELNKIGVNLNQIAREKNKNNIEHAELLIALDQIYSEVKKIREIYSE